MPENKKIVVFLSLCVGLTLAAYGQDAQATRAVGAVKSIQGSVISLKTDAGADLTINVADGARLLRTAPGQTDLKTASPIQLSDIQAGDRILARGKASEDSKTLAANLVVVMKQADVSAKQKKEEEDWQRNGVFGPVKSVDAATGAITLAPTTPGGPSISVQTSKDTIVRQYAPDSAHFDDAKLSSLAAVKTGDQLRARGTRGADGASLTAKEIVFGTFRNVAGTISSIDATNQTVTVNDLSTKKPVVVKISSDSQMHKLPAQLAQFIALRLRGGDLPGAAAQGGQRPQGAAATGAQGGGQTGGPPRQGGPMRMGDPMQMLSRLPQVPLTELQKGDALMIVTTQGNGTSVSAITLLAGVEAILTAPNASMILSPWNLGAGGGGDAQ
jgi:hypothetical protein